VKVWHDFLHYSLVLITSGKQSVLNCRPTHQTDWIMGMLEFWYMLPAFHSFKIHLSFIYLHFGIFFAF